MQSTYIVEGKNDWKPVIALDGEKYHPPEKRMEGWKLERTIERFLKCAIKQERIKKKMWMINL